MIISFSGLDGAGKTTQIEMLLASYRNLGARVGTVYSYMPDIRYHSTNELKELYNKLLPYDVIHIRYRMNSDRNSHIMQTLERILRSELLQLSLRFKGTVIIKS